MPLCCDVFLCCGDGDPLIAHISIRHKKSDPLALWIGFFNLYLFSSSFHQTITYRTKDTNQNIISPVNIMISGFPVTIIRTRYLEKNPAIRTIDKRFLIPRISYSRYSTAQAAIYFQIYRNAARYCPFIYTPLYTAYSTSRYPRTASPIAKISVIISIIPDCTLPCKNIQKSKKQNNERTHKKYSMLYLFSVAVQIVRTQVLL